MWINSSSNDSLHHPHPSPIISFHFTMINCFRSTSSSSPLITFSITNILLLLPLCVLILYLGLQRRLQQRSSSSTTTSHSDSFAYHAVVMELVGVAGSVSSCGGIYTGYLNFTWVGLSLVLFTWFGEMFFHLLTCVEHYLAVVHPLVYLGLRKERGIRIRNITTGCVWLLSITLTCLVMADRVLTAMHLCFLVLTFICVSFCSVSVLCVLIRPGPGEQGGDRERADQSKLRALYTIMAIMLVLLLKCSINLVWIALSVLRPGNDCAMMTCSLWFNLPGSLVLPVLFLHRSGKLQCCQSIIKPGRGSD